ncbi:3-deoxy-7-phosphoheptulonate synthase [Aliikangiella marina]|uniref:3-deoxy-7-phosphoheptulonate synthase n=1 Tax=Aliikangiella marina TaxID=1712262 RepID=A0A545TED1_9GAMM|nr:3-deoxy-7-phosphoheptulonate synthase [Aliikangiella marina]TQV75574.1 3-deoxy-7-phosphoheptulonate synthase [Aliikangiella marina]
MIIVLKPEATEVEAKEILAQIESVNLKPLYMPGTERIVLGALGDERILNNLNIGAHPMVENVKPILSTYKQVSRELQSHDTQVQFGDVTIGGGSFAIIAGPCAVENREQIFKSAELVKKYGAVGLRGGAFKPRTSPYSFQGLEEEGLQLLQEASKEYGLPCVTEIIDPAHVEMLEQYVDAFQIGARNMQNFKLLKAVGQSHKPAILKRGMSATIEELLLAAEYIYNEGNQNVIICERGIRTFEKATRNTLDLNAVAYIKTKSHLPVIVDPSHGTGIRELVGPMAKAAVACGADGVIVEAHYNPQVALSDGAQSLDEAHFAKLMNEIKPFIQAAGKVVA